MPRIVFIGMPEIFHPGVIQALQRDGCKADFIYCSILTRATFADGDVLVDYQVLGGEKIRAQLVEEWAKLQPSSLCVRYIIVERGEETYGSLGGNMHLYKMGWDLSKAGILRSVKFACFVGKKMVWLSSDEEESSEVPDVGQTNVMQGVVDSKGQFKGDFFQHNTGAAVFRGVPLPGQLLAEIDSAGSVCMARDSRVEALIERPPEVQVVVWLDDEAAARQKQRSNAKEQQPTVVDHQGKQCCCLLS